MVLQHITSHDRIFCNLFGSVFENGSQIRTKISIFVEPLVFNHWNNNLTNEETINEIFNAQALISAVC